MSYRRWQHYSFSHSYCWLNRYFLGVRSNNNVATSFTLDFHSIGSLNCFQDHRLVELAQNLNVRHDTMTTNDAWEIFDGRKEFYFVIKRNDLFIVGTGLIAVPLNFLGPRDHQSEIGCLRKLRQFRRLGR